MEGTMRSEMLLGAREIHAFSQKIHAMEALAGAKKPKNPLKSGH
jgi:hypothetical protein